MREISESRHWTRTEKLPGYAAAIVSIDARRVLLEADFRRRHPTLWNRILGKFRKLRWVTSSRPEA